MNPYLLIALAEGGLPHPQPLLLDPATDPRAWLDGSAPIDDLPPAARARLADRATLERAADRVYRDLERHDLQMLTPEHSAWPDRMRTVPLRPAVLFARGDISLLQRTPAVAVVGSRTPTNYGERAADAFAEALAFARVVIWSGLALGVDARAHRAALDVGTPTVAVLAGGLDRIDPTANARLGETIVAQGGLLLSEQPPGRRPTRGHFPRRNRILADATPAVLVVEAGLASGTMHTAARAAETDGTVLAVPGAWDSPRSRGCHELLIDGASVAADPAAVLRHLGIEDSLHGDQESATGLQLDADSVTVLRALERGARPVDLVERESRLPPARFLEVVFALEGAGLVRALPGDRLEGTGAHRVRRGGR